MIDIFEDDSVIAESLAFKEVVKKIRSYAGTEGNILLTGETGTGKSYLSRLIHNNSPRKLNPFIHVNCANLSKELLESELFGHEKGAFTGAHKLKRGKFELADKGTIFLDEIAEISNTVQTKLLRVLEEKEFERVGGSYTLKINTRIITATNKNLKDLMKKGLFREDLYYRLNVLPIHVPSLRERVECLPKLSHSILLELLNKYNKPQISFNTDVQNQILAYNWPGNIREMLNVIERAVILMDVDIDELEIAATHENLVYKYKNNPNDSNVNLEANEKRLIIATLETNLWIQKLAAKELGVSPRCLNYKIKKYNITHHTWRRNKK